VRREETRRRKSAPPRTSCAPGRHATRSITLRTQLHLADDARSSTLKHARALSRRSTPFAPGRQRVVHSQHAAANALAHPRAQRRLAVHLHQRLQSRTTPAPPRSLPHEDKDGAAYTITNTPPRTHGTGCSPGTTLAPHGSRTPALAPLMRTKTERRTASRTPASRYGSRSPSTAHGARSAAQPSPAFTPPCTPAPTTRTPLCSRSPSVDNARPHAPPCTSVACLSSRRPAPCSPRSSRAPPPFRFPYK
jgi:hypothetical protein